MRRPSLNKFTATLKNPVYLLRAPISRLLFVLALSQMSYASAVKKIHELGGYLTSLKSYLSGLGEQDESSNLDDLSNFFAEGPSRCRFPKYRLPALTLLVRFVLAPSQEAAEALTGTALGSDDLQTSRSDSFVAVGSVRRIIKAKIIWVSRRKYIVPVSVTANLVSLNGKMLATA